MPESENLATDNSPDNNPSHGESLSGVIVNNEGLEVTTPDVENISFDIGNAEELSGIQKAGIQILTGVGSVGIVFVVLIFVTSFWWIDKPSIPKPPSVPTSNAKEELVRYKEAVGLYERTIEQYKRSVDIYISTNKAQEERAKNLFQLFIVSALLPTFTSVLGYIFGIKSND
jgi:hypothetical protein